MRNSNWGSRFWAVPQLFDPENGLTVLEPPGSEAGYWAGAPGAFYEAESGTFHLYYRLRKPRGLGRGYECRIARSGDGVHFHDIWSATKEDINTPSMERAGITRTPDGRWRLYIGLVDPADGHWRVDMIEADAPDQFDVKQRTRIFTAGDVGVEGVKDPYPFMIGDRWYLLMSDAPLASAVSDEEKTRLHATGDVYTTGRITSETALAVSDDGVHFEWLGEVFSPREQGWDAYCTRINSLLYVPPVFLAFYDGAASVEENYEEKAGLAWSLDLRHFARITTDGPLMLSPHASRCIRYIEALRVGNEYFFYYEYARPDGSHELRVSRVKV